jgi:hypothetical protein
MLDAYCANEMGVKDTSANVDPRHPRTVTLLTKSRFTRVEAKSDGTVREIPESLVKSFPNQANPANNPRLVVKQTNAPADEPLENIWIYVSASTIAYKDKIGTGPWDTPVKVSVLYAVQYEMNRHGLRAFFEARPEPSALILVPGIEPRKKGDPRYGVGIRDVEIAELLRSVLGRDASFEVRVIAAFSTGINGLNQTLLNKLIDISHLERVVIYDCLYTLSSGDTASALRTARSTNPSVKILVYKCTSGGNSLEADNRLSVVAKNPGLIASDAVIDLFYLPAYAALITFRSIEGGLADGSASLTAGSALEAAFKAMATIVPARGTVVSSKRAFKYAFGSATLPTGATYLDDWASTKANLDIIRAFARHLGSVTKAVTIHNLIWENELPGWRGGDGEENHDLLLPDFGWEFLPG